MKLTRLFSYAVAAAILAAFLLTVDLAAVWDALDDTEPGTAALVVLLNLPVLAIFILRSQLVLRKLKYTVPLKVLAPVTVLGNVAGALTPAGAGEFLRAVALERNAGVRMEQGVGLVVYERLLSTYLLALGTAAFAAYQNLDATLALPIVGLCLAGVLAPWAGAVFVLGRLPQPSDSEAAASLPARLFRYFLTMAGQVRFLMVDLPLLLIWSSLTVVTFALLALQFLLVADSIAVDLSLADAWVTFGGSGIATIASFLPFGLGIGDGSMAAILHSTGIPLETSTAIVLLVRATVTLPLVALALASYLYLEKVSPETFATEATEPAQGS